MKNDPLDQAVQLLHETAHFNMKDLYFVLGVNPDGQGGGMIGSTDTKEQAIALRDEALKQNYSGVVIRNWYELN